MEEGCTSRSSVFGLNYPLDGYPMVIPIEFLKLVGVQRIPKQRLNKTIQTQTTEYALVGPATRKKDIEKMLTAKHSFTRELLDNYRLKLSSDMMVVNARKIDSSRLQLGGNTVEKLDSTGCWSLKQKSFVDVMSMDKWAILDFTNGELDVKKFEDALRDRDEKLGIKMTCHCVHRSTTMNDLKSMDKVEDLHDAIVLGVREFNKRKKLQIIVCVMPQKDAGYKYIKWILETKIGFVTQCCLLKFASQMIPAAVGNLCLKINAKLGGNNFEVKGGRGGFWISIRLII